MSGVNYPMAGDLQLLRKDGSWLASLGIHSFCIGFDKDNVYLSGYESIRILDKQGLLAGRGSQKGMLPYPRPGIVRNILADETYIYALSDSLMVDVWRK